MGKSFRPLEGRFSILSQITSINFPKKLRIPGKYMWVYVCACAPCATKNDAVNVWARLNIEENKRSEFYG